jgi:hypothetical protein
MTKDQYFEMCEQLDTTPVESEIPIDSSDFPIEVQLALTIYRMLRDEWEFMAGNYLGKNLNNILDIFDIYDITKKDKRFYLELINLIDSIRATEIRKTKTSEKPAT